MKSKQSETRIGRAPVHGGRREPRKLNMWGKALRNFFQDERGLEVVEYAILAGLIVAGIIATIAAIGAWVAGIFNSVKNAIGA